MHAANIFLTGLAGACLLALAACEDEQAGTQPADPPAAGTEQSDNADVDDAANKLKDAADQAAEAISEGARDLAEKGKKAADEAMENAGPAMEKASEVAKQLGTSVNEIVQRAAKDLQTAVDSLNERIDETDSDADPFTGDPDAVLAPDDQLNADTLAAAKAGPAGVGPDYVGVWAREADDCGTIDQDDTVREFAVITPTTIRRAESVCNFESTSMDDGKASIAAECLGADDTRDAELDLAMPSPDTLTIASGADGTGTEYVRCHLP